MRAVAGGRYQLELELVGATGTNLSWLVAAVRATYEGAHVESVRRVRGGAEAVIRTDRTAIVTPGDLISPVVEGITAPGMGVPEAVVTEVTPLTLPSTAVTNRALSYDATGPPEGWSSVDAAKLGIAALLIGATVLLSRRVSAKGVA